MIYEIGFSNRYIEICIDVRLPSKLSLEHFSALRQYVLMFIYIVYSIATVQKSNT